MTTLKSSLVHRRHKCGPRERACSRTTDYGLILCTSQAGPWSHTLWHRQVLAHFIMTRVTPGLKKSVAGQVIQTCLVLQSSDYHSTNRHFWEAGPWTQRRPLPHYEPCNSRVTGTCLGSSPARVTSAARRHAVNYAASGLLFRAVLSCALEGRRTAHSRKS